MICRQCKKEITGEGILFCPYCGTRFTGTADRELSAEAAEWIRKAMKATGLPERKKILEQARKACPGDPGIEWELLFIGTPDPKPPRGKLDYSIIKSWLLQIYRTPGDFSKEKRDAMRTELFEGPQLKAVLEAAENPEARIREYLLRLCEEYIDIFLKEDNRLMGNLFGFRVGRNRDKILEDTVTGMMQQVEADGQLTTEQKQMLREAMIRALESPNKG